jgi:PAS domain-containing protein
MATAMADGRILAWSERRSALAVEELRERAALRHARPISTSCLSCSTEGRITHCNEYLLRLTGWTAEEVLGKNWFEVRAGRATGGARCTLALLADRPSGITRTRSSPGPAHAG